MSERVAIIGCVGVPAKYGGFETLAQNLVQALGSTIEMTVYCEAGRYRHRPGRYLGARLVYLPLRANGPLSVAYDCLSLIHAALTHDVLLLLGVSGALLLPLVRLLPGKRVIVNIDGREWRRGKWGRLACWFLRLCEGLAVRFADVVIADNAAIQAGVRESYGREAMLVEYGGDHARASRPSVRDLREFPFLGSPYAFLVCRIEPENSIHTILEAFRRRTDLPLVIVGNWNANVYGKSLRREFAKIRHIILLDPIYDQRRLDALRSGCAVYVHGHSVGGTNPSLVEAMSLGLPILAYDVVYNRETTEGKALFFSDAETLQALLSPERREQWLDMGRKLRRVAAWRYTWRRIVSSYRHLFTGPGVPLGPRPLRPVSARAPGRMAG